ncbi:MAG: DUF2281 domain-containing protein [Chloroflexi bacterium]|nr:MAG: DUF2281 domain-containing protein [Chloroflexota bacterium]
MKNLEEIVRQLPPELQQEVAEFIDSLLERQMRRPKGKPDFRWAGALKDLREQYTSVELQHKIAEWRGASR